MDLRYNSANQPKYSQNLLPIIITNLYIIIVSNIIDDIQNMIFSVVYRLSFYPVSILIKIYILVICTWQQFLHTIKPSLISLIESQQKYRLGLPGSWICLLQKIQLIWLSWINNSWTSVSHITIIIIFGFFIFIQYLPPLRMRITRGKNPLEKDTNYSPHFWEYWIGLIYKASLNSTRKFKFKFNNSFYQCTK